MKYRILVKKVHFIEKKYLTAEEIKDICKKIGIEYKYGINYLIRTKHLVRILKGFFYVRSLKERSEGTREVIFFEALANALKYKGVTNWYFGLDTAIKLNNLTHEYFAIDYVISDRLFRARPISILGHKVKFIKLNKKLFGFGVKSNGFINYSDPEKTFLDIIHIRKHSGFENDAIKNELADLIEHLDKRKIMRYAKNYSKSVRNFLKMIL